MKASGQDGYGGREQHVGLPLEGTRSVVNQGCRRRDEGRRVSVDIVSGSGWEEVDI